MSEGARAVEQPETTSTADDAPVLLLRSGSGEAGGMLKWVVAGALLVLIILMLVLLKLHERRGR